MSDVEPRIPVPPGAEAAAPADAAPPAPEVVAAPIAGIPVPPGAPPGYRGYGITAPTAVEGATDSEPVAPAPTVEPDLESESAELEGGTDSDTVAAPAPPELDPRDWLLRLPDGSGLLVDRMLLLGRSPDPAKGPPGARPVPLDDPARTVSRTHLVIGPSGPGELLARNVSGVNALVVIGADGAECKVQPGGSIVLVDVARLLVGAYPIALERI